MTEVEPKQRKEKRGIETHGFVFVRDTKRERDLIALKHQVLIYRRGGRKEGTSDYNNGGRRQETKGLTQRQSHKIGKSNFFFCKRSINKKGFSQKTHRGARRPNKGGGGGNQHRYRMVAANLGLALAEGRNDKTVMGKQDKKNQS